MRVRMGNHNKLSRIGRFVRNAMMKPWRNFRPLVCQKHLALIINFQCQRSGEDKEELSGSLVEVFPFGRSRRHSFMDHTEIRSVNQMPTIAILSPRIMGRVLFTNHSILPSASGVLPYLQYCSGSGQSTSRNFLSPAWCLLSLQMPLPDYRIHSTIPDNAQRST